MLQLLEQDRKRQYLDLCKHNYAEAVSVIQELFPEFYVRRDPFDSLYDKAMESKKRGNTDEEIQILETAIAGSSAVPYCYERLAVLYSKANNHSTAYEICMKWFDSGFWKMPNSATTSLKLLDRLEKLERKV
jgi:tetratricopeptide (TPR) repeat protein